MALPRSRLSVREPFEPSLDAGGSLVARVLASVLLLLSLALPTASWARPDFSFSLEFLGRYESTIFDEGGAEIVAFHAPTARLFVVNANDASLDVLDLADPTAPTRVTQIDLSTLGGEVNSVAVEGDLVAAAVEAVVPQDPGLVVFLSATTLAQLGTVPTGALPDAVTFSQGGRYLLVANEGEPNDDYTVDPEGSISIVDLADGVAAATVATADFNAYDTRKDELIAEGVRIFGPGASVSQDLEPEFITANSKTAWVVCQEANALAIVDIRTATVTDIVALGTKDHAALGNELDASNRDAGIVIRSWPVHGMYQPDGIDSFKVRGQTYVISANEGDSRDYDGFSEEERVGDLPLDPGAFPNAAVLQLDENLGRLNITTTLGENANGDYEALFSYGARSFSIWNAAGELVFDSGNQLEVLTSMLLPAQFNSTNDDNDSFDNRSDDKGPEPEGVVVGRVRGRQLAFIGLERIGGIMLYDVSDPTAPVYQDYINTRNFSVLACQQLDDEGDCVTGAGESNPAAGDLGPEGLVFIPADDSPTGDPLLAVGNEVSGTTSIFRVLVD